MPETNTHAGPGAAAREIDEPLPLGDDPSPRGRRKTARHRVRSRHERAGRKAGVPVKAISLSVPSSLATAWRTYGQSRRHSLVDVMLDAIKATGVTAADGTVTVSGSRLPELVRGQQAAARADRLPISDGLFLRTPPSTPDDDPGADPLVTVPLRMLSTNVDVLDSLAYQTAAESRSQLVVAALAPFLVEKGVLVAPEAPVAGERAI